MRGINKTFPQQALADELPAWLARLTLLVVFLFAALTGGFVAGGGLHDPDTCWLLALGRWIVEHHTLPQTDPFSYTYAMVWLDKPIVLYQWLSEVIFYGTLQLAGLVGLVVLAAAVLCLAFIVLPGRFFHKAGLALLPSISLVLLGLVGASFHFLSRPEIFSYLLFAVWIELVDHLCLGSHKALNWKLILILGFVMVLWCNLHSGFVVGIAYLVVYLLIATWEKLMLGPLPRPGIWTALGSLAVCALATLCNPWGWGLWGYLPGLFFCPLNQYIVELKPLGWAELSDLTYWPFFILGFLGLLRAGCASKDNGWRHVGLLGPLFVVVAIIMGLACRRLIPFSVLLVFAGIAQICRRCSYGKLPGLSSVQPTVTGVTIAQDGEIGEAPVCRQPGIIGRWEGNLARLIKVDGWQWSLAIVCLASLGAVLMATQIVPPQLPQGSIAFEPPWAAIRYVSTHRPSGHLLNDPQFGDVMIWHLRPAPQVFLDTRFDMYGDKLVADYLSMVHCRGQWQKLLNQYEISWVFLPASSELVRELCRNKAWCQLYVDNNAAILSRMDNR